MAKPPFLSQMFSKSKAPASGGKTSKGSSKTMKTGSKTKKKC